ncbi:MAG: hypothetical protein Q8N53_08290, partial [Longimicrobiales bacterium]|nr:hypothetical protein [Longimicrobiales bacterium]
SIPSGEVRRIEVFTGRQGHVFKDMLRTTAISAGALGILTAVDYAESGEFMGYLVPDSPTQAFVWGAVTGAVIGVPIGLIVGLVNVQEIWEDVGVGQEVPPKPALRVAPMPGGGFSLAASIPLGAR